GHRARLVPPDPDRKRARALHAGGRLLARALRRNACRARRVSHRASGGRRASPPATGGRRGGRSARSRLAPDRRTAPRAAARTGRAVLPVEVSRRGSLVERPSVLALAAA